MRTTQNTVTEYQPNELELAEVRDAVRLIQQPGVLQLTPKQAFHGGLNIRRAYRINPAATRAAVLNLVGGVCRFVDAKRTLSTEEDLIFCTEVILTKYPALKIEELRLIFDGVKRGEYGKYYERFKLAEIEDAIQTYEGTTRAALLEEAHTYKSVSRGVEDVKQIKHEPQSMADLRRKQWFEKFYPTTTGK